MKFQDEKNAHFHFIIRAKLIETYHFLCLITLCWIGVDMLLELGLSPALLMDLWVAATSPHKCYVIIPPLMFCVLTSFLKSLIFCSDMAGLAWAEL